MHLTTEYKQFLDLHEQQLVTSGIPNHFWKVLHEKISKSTFDIGLDITLLKVDYDEAKNPEDPVYILQVTNENGLKHEDGQHIYLVDHAWTFRAEQATENLLKHESLLQRMCNLMGIDEETKEKSVLRVSELMWKYCQSYTIENAVNIEDRLPVWYIMDEIGSAIIHNDAPNFRAVPFVYLPDKLTYTLIFPVKDLDFGDFISRNFAEGVHFEVKDAFLLPWVSKSFLDVDYQQYEPDEGYFLSGHIEESLPSDTEGDFDKKLPLKVFSEYELIEQHLRRNEFVFCSEKNADVLWYTKHFKNYSELQGKYVNQFPFENVVTIKDLLSIVCRRKCIEGNYPSWLPITYNLKTEINKFISFFQQRNKNKEPNYWIIKPWNLARGLDTYITSNIDQILRLAFVGPPKICQLYISNPVLFYRPECEGKVKFDIRYVILLKSIKPLSAYIYKNFFIRFSNKPFELKDFYDYEKHFTVMNYNENVVLKHMLCAEFLDQWKIQYPNYNFNEIEHKIMICLRETFEAATMLPPPRGIAPSKYSRALYAADIMLEWDKNEIQPKLLEINWTPDCQRACDYYPDFYNKIFGLLFLEEKDDIFAEI